MRILILISLFLPASVLAESRPYFLGDEAWDKKHPLITTSHSVHTQEVKNSNYRNGIYFSSSTQSNDQINSSIRYMSALENNLVRRLTLTRNEAKSLSFSQDFSELGMGFNYEMGQNKFILDYAKNIEGDVYNDRLSFSLEHEVDNLTFLAGYHITDGQIAPSNSKSELGMVGLRYENRSKNNDKFAALYFIDDDQSSQSNQYLNADFRYLSKNHSSYIIGIDGKVHKQFNGLKAYNYEIGLIGAYSWSRSQVAIIPGIKVTGEYQTDNFKALRSTNSYLYFTYSHELENDLYLNASVRFDDQRFSYNDILDRPLNRARLESRLPSLSITKFFN